MTADKDRLVAGLIEKRAELAGIIDKLQQQLDEHRADLTHIDGVLRMLESGLDPETIRPKRPYQFYQYFERNELSRLCLGAFRTAAGTPLNVGDITDQVIATKGFDPRDSALRARIRIQIGDIIKRQQRRGEIERTGSGPQLSGS